MVLACLLVRQSACLSSSDSIVHVFTSSVARLFTGSMIRLFVIRWSACLLVRWSACLLVRQSLFVIGWFDGPLVCHQLARWSACLLVGWFTGSTVRCSARRPSSDFQILPLVALTWFDYGMMGRDIDAPSVPLYSFQMPWEEEGEGERVQSLCAISVSNKPS